MMASGIQARTALAWMVAVLLAPACFAQAWREMWSEPAIRQSDLIRLMEAIGLEQDDDFAVVLLALHDEFKVLLLKRAEPYLEDLEARKTQEQRWLAANPSITNIRTQTDKDFGLIEVGAAWEIEKARLTHGFEDDILRIFDEPLRHRLRRELSRLRRERVLPDISRFTPTLGQVVDVAAIVDSIDSESDYPVVDEYVQATDVLLRRWEIEYPTITKELRQERWREASERLGQLIQESYRQTQEYAEQIHASMDNDAARRFMREYRRRTYPALYVACPVEIAVKELRFVDELTTSMRNAIEAIYDSYSARREEIRNSMILAFDRWNNPKLARARADTFDRHTTGAQATRELGEEIAPILGAWIDASDEACEQLRSLFTSEMALTLPPQVRLILFR